MEIHIEDVTVLNDLRERLGRVTEAEIATAERRLAAAAVTAAAEASPEEKDKALDVIGVVTNVTTRALYALWLVMQGEEDLEKAKAKLANDEFAEKDHEDKSAILHMFASVVGELFWTQARLDLGFVEQRSIALHAGWKLIRKSEPRGGFAFMRQLGLPE